MRVDKNRTSEVARIVQLRRAEMFGLAESKEHLTTNLGVRSSNLFGDNRLDAERKHVVAPLRRHGDEPSDHVSGTIATRLDGRDRGTLT